MNIILLKFEFSFFFRNGDEKDVMQTKIEAKGKHEANLKFEEWLKSEAPRVIQRGIIRNSIEDKEI